MVMPAVTYQDLTVYISVISVKMIMSSSVDIKTLTCLFILPYKEGR